MPLYRSPAIDAIKLRKANPYSYWGSRESRNRVEPIADPDFDLDLALEPGDSIFTIGSCFARNVESKLADAGFRLPMRDLLGEPAFAGVDPGALNNFSTPSIWNELSWAVGARTFDEQAAIVEYAPDKWIDLHGTANLRPTSRELVLRQRAAVTGAYRRFAECKLIVMTLGLVEVWFDREADCYLNAIPAPPLVRRWPDRFELHVLDYPETLDFCERSIELLSRDGRPDATILISVSPVALGVTHRPQDVLTANCYSKSVLRAVVEQVVARHGNVHYFPSYESATLSDRRIAWANDFTHVTDTLIAHNVDRLVRRLSAHVGDGDGEDRIRAEIAEEGAAAAYRHALAARKAEPAAAERFFDEFAVWSERSPTFATEHVEWLVERRRGEEAIALAARCDVHNERTALALARALVITKRAGDAVAVLDGPLFRNSRANRYFALRVEAEGKAGDLQALEATLMRWLEALPKKAAVARAHVARALLRRSSIARAIELLDLALVAEPGMTLANLLAAEARLALGEKVAAKRFLDRVEPRHDGERRQVAKLMSRLSESEKEAA